MAEHECEGCVHDAGGEDTYTIYAEAQNAASLGDYELARDAFRRAIAAGDARGESTVGIKLSLIDLLDRMEDDDGIVALADDLDGQGVQSAAINIVRTGAYLRAGCIDEAIAAGRAAIADLERDGGFVQGALVLHPLEAWHRYGLALRFGGEAEASLAPFRRAIELDPLRARSHFDLAIALSATGDRAAAADSVERALTLDPGDNNAHYNLACYRALLGDRAAALAALARAVELEADNAALALDDDDLASLRGDAAFAQICNRSAVA